MGYQIRFSAIRQEMVRFLTETEPQKGEKRISWAEWKERKKINPKNCDKRDTTSKLHVNEEPPLISVNQDFAGDSIEIDKFDLMLMPLDPDRPILEQMEERAMADDQDMSSLIKNIYQNPKLLSLLTGVTSISTKRLLKVKDQAEQAKTEPDPELAVKSLFEGMSDEDISELIVDVEKEVFSKKL